MSNEDGTCWISYNGEFYNHAECRKKLEGEGHKFRGTSDTETLLHLLEEEGVDCLSDIAGIFAFAFWDSKQKRLILVRDPLGVKQLYYHDNGKRIVFANEIKALLECKDIPRDFDSTALNQYLHFHTPLFSRTFFKDIKQLRAGEFLQVTPGDIRKRTYWRLSDFGSLNNTPEESVAELKERLAAVVKDQLMSDVPVGLFFSGGIDSCALAVFAARDGKPPPCFGVHFTDQDVVDERPFQEAAASALGLELHLTTVDGLTFPDDLMRLIYYQDQPVIGAAMLPMYYVSKLASRHVKVCLGGQGGDEIFGGYARYALTQPVQVMKSWFTGRQRIGSSLATSSREVGNVGGNLWKQFADVRTLRRLIHNVMSLGHWQKRHFDTFAKVQESAWRAIFNDPEIVSREKCRNLFQNAVLDSPARNPADKVMHWEVQTYLTGLFHQDDRMSMACSLESRVPLADPRLVEFAFRLGFDLKFRGGATKWILRQAVADIIPASVLNRRKVGFDTPADRWMKGQHRGFIRELLLGPEARSRGIWNTKGLMAILDRPNHPLWFDIVWKMTCIEAWARVFLDRRTTVVPPDDTE
jgi:asparagine synthase (glutamine-hydrolysing)